MEPVVKDLPNISEFSNLSHLPYLATGILLVDVFVLFLTRYYPEKVGGDTLNEWYDRFGLEGVIADVGIILIGFLLGQFFYTRYIAPTYGWKPLLFVLLVVGIQVVHDVAFYYGVIKPIPKGVNDMIDTYKRYADENGALIIPGDSLLMIGSALVTFGLESIPAEWAAAAGVLGLYTLPHILNTKKQGTYKWVSPAEQAAEDAAAKQKKKQEVEMERELSPWSLLQPQVQQANPLMAERKSMW